MPTNLLGLIEQNPLIFTIILIWSLFWKGWALWRSSQLNQRYWFIAVLIFNTFGLLEILYLFVFSKKCCCGGCLCGEPKKTFSADEAKVIGEKLGLDWSKFDVEQFQQGISVELEHGKRNAQTNVSNDDSLTTGKIALAHLNEFSDYYTRLDKMEKEADEFWEGVKTI